MPVSVASDLQPGARNAVRVCLNIQPRERVTVITDESCRAIADSLIAEIEEVGAPYAMFVLEEVASRPLAALPDVIAADMELSDVSIFAAHAQANELGSRMQMTDIVNRRKMRHAHMVNITPQIMREGMRADYAKVDAISTQVLNIVRQAKVIRATTPGGSDFSATLNPAYRWIKTSGLISREKWGNLPGGEVFTTPGEVNGTLVIDGVVGDWLCDRYGDLKNTPLTLRIERQPARSGHVEPTRRSSGTSGPTRTPTRTAIASGNLRLAPTSSCTRSSAIFCRTRNFPAFTSPSAIPTARTPAPTGTRPRTSTSSAPNSASGWTTSRSWSAGAS